MKKKILILITAILCMLLLCSCGSKIEAVEPNPTPAATAAPTPEPTPEPTPVPQGDPIFFEGGELNTYMPGGERCIKVAEALERLGCRLEDGKAVWRGEQMEFPDEYEEIMSFCARMKIGTLDDEENGMLYCTAAAGDWELPQGYNVPVFMYHGVGAGSDAANLFVKTSEFENQLKYLTENGYSPIWFEDLWHVQDYKKPVILVFDDGWLNNYTDAFPLCKKYNVKITVAPVCSDIDEYSNKMTSEMLQEMYESGLVIFESHTYNHAYLDTIPKEEQRTELEDSKLWITRRFGYIPIALIYPSGTNTDYVRETLINGEHIYRFGVLMLGMRSYNTSDNPAKVYRFWPQRDTSIIEFAMCLENTFKDK